ncbi:MAG: tripartite tricarboxylate transporter substrate binding protein [Burkholderiales bacterium]|nr:tripartite tricarboxylate transporter substrate binding protein [Burkholderiales bacterium]
MKTKTSLPRLLGATLAACALAAAPAVFAQATQAFPSKPIRIVVPAAPGGGTDILARLLSPELNKQFGQQIIVENRAGGATMIGTEFVARSAPDGHTMVIATTPHAINPTLYKKVPFDPVKDFTMISQLGLTTTVLVVHPSLPVKNVKEFIALAKSKPGQLTAGTAAGNSAYLAVEMLKTMAGIDALNIPYKGAGQALSDLVAGQIQFQVNTLLAAKPFIEMGRLRAIGVCSAQRSAALPGVQAIGETVKGFNTSGWYALLGPAGIPRETTLRIHDGFAKALRTPEITKRLADQGVEVTAGTPDELSKIMPLEIKKWGEVVKSSGATPG